MTGPRVHAALAYMIAAGVIACTDYSENSATCGFLSMAGATKVLQFMENVHAILRDAPPDLEGTVGARVVGYGTAHAVAAQGPIGAILSYEGEGLPTVPGFGLVLVDDSSEVVRGVLIFETEPPRGYPQIGTIASAAATLPLFAIRVNWNIVSDPRCPLIRELRSQPSNAQGENEMSAAGSDETGA